MTLSRRPNRRSESERHQAFVEQAAAADVRDLHCQIPAGLHRLIRVRAAERGIKMTAVVIEALESYFEASP
jgi:hypothetical protein